MTTLRPLLLVAAVAVATPAQAFDFDTELAPFLIGPAVIPTILLTRQNAMDAPLVLRQTMFFSMAWFDATAPYTEQSVGLFSRIPNRPLPEHTQRNQNIACFYASYQAAMNLWPEQETEWRNLLLDVGLDPDDTSTDLTSPVGIGNVAGAAMVENMENDGMNQLGNGNGRGLYNRRPYEDTTGYAPVNTAYELDDPSRWQPLIVTEGRGLFGIQQYVTPQWAETRAFSFSDASEFDNLPKPRNSDWKKRKHAYRAQADYVRDVQVNLTDEQKVLAELFNNKLISLGQATGIAAFIRGLNLRQTIELDMISHAASWDAGIYTWAQKTRYDAVRPVTAIHFLYGDDVIAGWAGPGKGTQDILGKHWESYLPTPDHPEYPSGSQAFCSAHAQAMRRYFGDDNFGWPAVFPAGSSYREPGVTPATDIVHVFETWTEFEDLCGVSRIWAGVHFEDAVTSIKEPARAIGDLASDYILAHIDGTIGGDDDDDDDDDCDSD